MASGGSRAGGHFPAQVALWDVATGQRRATLPRQGGPIAFSPQGNVLATIHNPSAPAFWQSDPPTSDKPAR